MKVLVIGSRIPFPLRDGGAIATFNLLKGLSDLGLKVDYLSLNTKKHFVDRATIDKEFSFLNQVFVFDIDTSVKPVAALTNLFSNKSYNIERFVNKNIADNIRQIVEEHSYDILHFEGLFVADYVKGLSHPHKILRQHNIEFEIWKTLSKSLSIGLKRWYTGLLARRLERYERSITGLFDAVVSITETDRLKTINHFAYKGRTQYIPAGIIHKEITGSGVDLNAVYHIGSMEWMPNQEAMKWFHDSIWPLIEQKAPTVQFYMGGKHMPESFRAYNQGHFHVLGEIPELDAFVADKSILAVPLRSGSGIRIKTIEGMMSGKAVVTTTLGAQGLELKNGENCMIADQAEDFAEAIAELTKDPSKRHQIAEIGKQYAIHHFSNASVSLQWLELYRQLTQK